MSNPHPRKWSARDLERIRRMFLSDGATYLQIAETMGSTRSAIAGLCGRRLWHRTPKAIPEPPKPVRKIGLRARPIGKIKVRIAPRPVNTGAGKCQWINGDPLIDKTFCGRPGFPWCDDHQAKCYIPTKVRAR